MKKRLLKDQLGFTKQEQTGILVLLTLIALMHGIPRLRQQFAPASLPIDSTFQAEVLAFQQQLAAADTVKAGRTHYPRYQDKRPRNAYYQLRDSPTRGFSSRNFPRTAHYPLRTANYSPPTASFPKRPRKPLIIQINTADSAAFEALPGIGPTLASRLVRFRDKLGGFYSITQVAETYGLPDSTFKKIQASLRLDSGSLKKLNINKMDEKSLGQHPYIRYKLARLIVQYRSIHGPFSQPGDLYNIPLVNDSIYRKLEKYINL